MNDVALGHGFESALEAAKVGSDWAWAAIYREIAGPVTGFFRARGANDPDGALADVFFDISRDISRFDGDEGDFHTMVFKAAYSRLMEERYSDSPPRSQLADRVLDRIKRDAGPPEEPAAGNVDDALRRAFEMMTQDERDVMSLRVVGGLDVEQTASVINRGVDSVKSLQRKALNRIRRIKPPEVVLT